MNGFSWTQPCCTACWNERNPNRRARAFVEGEREVEVCVYCGEWTRSGIYVREDPATAAHPSLEKA